MKVSELLAQVNKVKPNTYDDTTLLKWVNRAEAMVQTEAMKIQPEAVTEYFLPEDTNTDMLLPPPYDQIYELYVEAQVDYAQQEFGTYNNTMVLFNSAYSEMLAYYVKKNNADLKITVEL